MINTFSFSNQSVTCFLSINIVICNVNTNFDEDICILYDTTFNNTFLVFSIIFTMFLILTKPQTCLSFTIIEEPV